MADSDPSPKLTPETQQVEDLAAVPTDQPAAQDAPKRKWGRLALMVSIPLLLLAVGGYFWLTSGRSASTDNAYVQQDKISVAAEVGGRIVEVHVRENQQVKAGDLLYRIDPEPYRIAIAQADAQIAQAQVNVATLQQAVATNGSSIAAAQDSVKYAQQQYNRNEELMRRGFNTRANMDAAHHTLVQAQQELLSARGQAAEDQAKLQTGTTTGGQNPAIAAALAAKAQAELNLSRTEIRAPADGVVTQTSGLQVGQMAVQGLPGLTLVRNNQSWVDANFKETDLAKMVQGQRAEVEVDAYPGLKLRGHIESLGAGTGSEFSILPAQNASGNWVKVTQRVPVRIAIDEKSDRPLRAGLSAHVTVYFDDGSTTKVSAK